MAIDSTDLALVTARVGCCRLGASRLGFTPYDVKGPGSAYPCEYIWREVQPPTTQWTLVTEGVVCGKRPVADFTYSGEVTPGDPPVAEFSAVAEASGIIGSGVGSFTDESTDGTPPYTYSWDFGDDDPGDTSTDQNPTYTYDDSVSPGAISYTFTVTLTVTDSSGQIDSVQHDVEIFFDQPI